MKYESMAFKPARGDLDEARALSWLESQDHVYRDPVRDWYVICWSPRSAWLGRRHLEENRAYGYTSLIVSFHKGTMWLGGDTDRDQDARALEFLRAIHPEGGWLVDANGQDLGLVTDPAVFSPTTSPTLPPSRMI
ncbi:MAG: hypothetical protein H6739_25110 [Alphaproteobacteria bacterium]|nr:hypothetical protein [Alphaproteobacteria bacterium]